jgi:cytosine/adenosine deaminase-related metal-dependent hydrolase
MIDLLLRPSSVLPLGGELEAREGWSVLVREGVIVAVGAEADTLAAEGAEVIDLAGCLLMPGLVNAHQHGRGLTQVQLGFPDMILEAWQTLKRRLGWLDPAAMVPLAAMRMLASGTTACIHANTAWGGPDQAGDLARTIAAYDAAGLRAMVGIGVQDRAGLVFPAEAQATFVASLPAPLRALVGEPDATPFARTAAEAEALFDRLAAALPSHGRVTLCFAPAGPQWVSDGLFAEIAAAARSRGVPLHLHALESVAQADAARGLYPEGTLARLRALGVLGPATSIAHAVHVSGPEAALAAETGTILVRNPSSNLRLGCGAAPLAEWLGLGVRAAIGTDNQTLDDTEDLWTELRLARALAATPSWHAPPRPDAARLLAMATEAGAAAMGLGGKIGRIAPGFRADLVALDLGSLRGAWADPSLPLAELLVARASAAAVRMTMVDGRVLYRDGAFPGLDPGAVAAAAAEAAEAAHGAASPERVEAVAALVEAVSAFHRARWR